MTLAAPASIGILADDLTSATDGAAAFLAKGYRPLVCSGLKGLRAGQVVAVDTGSRAATATQATHRAERAAAALADRDILYKTVDSTLRGHIREEVAAAFQASGRPRLIVAPAFPDAGRQTIGGVQWVHGVPVEASDYGRDPVHPARTSRIIDLLDPALGPVRICDEAGLQDAAPVAASDLPVLILDARTQEALNRQVAKVSDPRDALWVGSPGLAIALASRVGWCVETPEVEAEARADRLLVVVGSANPLSHAQAEVLEAGGATLVADLSEAPAASRVVCLRAPSDRRPDPADVLTRLAFQSADALERAQFDGLVATGGETIAAILERIGVCSFVLTRELEPGFPVGLASRSDGSLLVIAMKAGGFGSVQTLAHAAEALLRTPNRERT